MAALQVASRTWGEQARDAGTIGITLLRQLRRAALDPSPHTFAFTDCGVTDSVPIMHQQIGCNTYSAEWKNNKILADAAVIFY